MTFLRCERWHEGGQKNVQKGKNPKLRKLVMESEITKNRSCYLFTDLKTIKKQRL